MEGFSLQVYDHLKQPGIIEGIELLIRQHGRFLCTCFLRTAALKASREDLIPALNAIEETAENQHISIAVVQGRLIFVPDDDGIGRVMKKGDYEKGQSYLTSLFVNAGMTALDIGANCGFHTTYLSRLVGPTGRVIAFEPDPYNFDLLRRNMNLNGATNVLAYRVATSDVSGPAKLHMAEDMNYGDHRTWQDKPRKKSVDIQKIRLDEAIPDGEVQFIKIDVQGDELRTFLGGEKLLRRSQSMAIICELWPYGVKQSGPGTARDLIDLLHSCGFQMSLWSEKENCGYRCSPEKVKELIGMNEGDHRALVEMIALKGDFLKHQN